MHFKAASGKPKATLEISGVTYEIKAPTVGAASKLVDDLDLAKASVKDQSLLMKKFICELGNMPLEEVEKIEQQTFNELFDYVISSKKN